MSADISSYTPQGAHTITAYLIVSSAAKVLDFAKEVFGAEEIMRMPTPDGGVAHAELRLGDSLLEMGDASENWPEMPGSLHVYVPDVDAAYERALAAGAESIQPPSDKFYGERGASVRDVVGNLWHLATKTEDVPFDEMMRRAEEYHKQQSS